MITDKQQRHISNIIQSELGFTNGWWIDEKSYDEHCMKAAKRIRTYLRKVLKISINPPVMRCRHDFNRLVGFKGKSRIMRCRKCGERKVSGGVA